MRVDIPKRARYRLVQVPLETPIGVMDGHAMEVRFGGQRYQLVGNQQNDDGSFDAINVDSGEIVQLRGKQCG